MSTQHHTAFMSYARADDKRGYVSRFRERLTEEVEVFLGSEFSIFQDSIHIHWGEDWKTRITTSLDEVALFIPILTPSFFNSSACREETELFLLREKALKRNDLILPVYFVDCDALNEKGTVRIDELGHALNKHQRVDWRDYRLRSYDEPEVGSVLQNLALGVKKAIQRTGHPPRHKTPSSSGFDLSTYKLPPNLEELIAQLVSGLARQQSRAQQKSGPSGTKRKNLQPRRKSAKTSSVKARGVGNTDGQYEENVFISAPFDDRYRPMFEALVFAVIDAGFRPMGFFEISEKPMPRLEKILESVAQCKYGVFDISRTELSKGLPRFNPPFELGLFLGGWKYGNSLQRKKRVLVLDRHAYRYQQVLSDLSGRDVAAHANRPRSIITIVRNWLALSSDRIISSGSEIYRRYLLFRRALPKISGDLGIQPEKLSNVDYVFMVASFLKEYHSTTER